MKRGQKVWVCYDGKFSRRVEGEILSVKPHGILVRFEEWGSDEVNIITHLFRTRNKNRGKKDYWSYVPVNKSLMNMLWGAYGDYYRVMDQRDWNAYWDMRHQKWLKKFRRKHPGKVVE